tara:strand:- start:111 stop:320 length:210 start_codon:yes stop_codon:yes gene_type:complete
MLSLSMSCRIVEIPKGLYSLSVWDTNDEMIFCNVSKNKSRLMQIAKNEYGFSKEEIIGYAEVFGKYDSL